MERAELLACYLQMSFGIMFSVGDQYAAVSACEAMIRSIERGVLEREMREHITKLREQMAQLEQGRPIDV